MKPSLGPYEASVGATVECLTCRRPFVKTIGMEEPSIAHRFLETAAGLRHCVCALCDTCLALEALRA